jgi:hypothetical protein
MKDLLIRFKRQSEDNWVVGIRTADAGQWLLAPRKSSTEPQSGDEWKHCIECPCAHALRTKSIRYDPGVSGLESGGALSVTHDFDDLHSYRCPDFIRHFTSSVCLYLSDEKLTCDIGFEDPIYKFMLPEPELTNQLNF